MTMHLAAYYQSEAISSVLTKLDAVSDQAIFTDGDDVRVPSGLTNLLWEAALSASTSPIAAQVVSPSLRALAPQDVQPVINAVVFTKPYSFQNHMFSPRVLAANESVNFLINADDATAAANYGLIALGDGPAKPTSGNIFSVEATGAASLSAGTWVNTALTFNSTLPAGTYQVVGMYAEGSNLVAARLSFVGQGFRPGVPANSSLAYNLFPEFRMGRTGVYGSFDINQPPTVDCLGVTDSSQTFILDLIRAGATTNG